MRKHTEHYKTDKISAASQKANIPIPETRHRDIKGSRTNRRGSGRTRLRVFQAPAADRLSRPGSCLVHHPCVLQGSVPGSRARSHLVLPAVQLQEECLPRGRRQQEHSTLSGQKQGLWGLAGASGASSHHPSPAEL